MIFFSLGLASPFADWCDKIAARLAARALGDVAFAAANSLDELALTIINSTSAHFVVSARQPVIKLCAALSQANRGFLVALDDPLVALQSLVGNHGGDLVETTRTIAKSCASMVGCLAFPGALVLRANQSASDPIAAATAIAAHLGLPATAADIANIVGSLARESVSWPEGGRDVSWWDSLDSDRRALVDGALEAYVNLFSGGELGPIAWERDLFYIDEASKPVRASRPVDITGKSRLVLYGPYISLPPGSWTASVALGFSPEAAEMSYVVEVVAGADRQLTHVRIHPQQDRFVEAQLSFSIDESIDQLIEVRVQNERAAFDGRLALGRVTITPQAHMRSETEHYLKTVLGE